MSARILVVDDIEANVRLLEAKLTAEYYEVSTALDGPTALAMAARDLPDIILLDVMMPGMDGFTVCRKLKDDPATRHIPVVLITALDGRTVRSVPFTAEGPYTTDIALDGMADGLYVLHVRDGEGRRLGTARFEVVR